MTVSDLAQSLDVQTHQTGDNIWFTYGIHLVEIPAYGDSVSIDRQPVKLGSPIVNQSGSVCLPIANLAKALGAEAVEYKPDIILFKPIGTTDTAVRSTSAVGNPTVNAAIKLVIGNDGTAKSDILTISAPAVEKSPENFGTLINQTITGTQTGKAYSLIITATDANGSPIEAGGIIYVTFATGAIDKTGTLTYAGKDIDTKPVAVILDSTGKAVLTYAVGSAPTNWDAYDNDEITISNSESMSATSCTNEVSVYNNVFDNHFTVTSK
jgi:phospholipase C